MSATMISLSTEKLVTDAELRRLREGSYENKVRLVKEAIEATKHTHFVAEASVDVLATHEKYVVVSVEDSFHQVFFEQADNGQISIVGTSPLQVESYSADNLSEYVRKEAREAVDLFLRGSVRSAMDRIETAARYIQPADTGLVDLVAPVQEEVSRETSWKAVLKEKSKVIKRTIRSQLGEDSIGALEATKFHKLYDGSLTEEELTGYNDLVNADLESALNRITGLWEDTEEAVSQAAEYLEKDADSDPILAVFKDFAAGLAEDLQTLQERCTVAAESAVDDVSVLGKLRDTIVEGLRPYEVGSLFVVAVAQRLTEAQ